jgi:hypothetical protein
MASIAHSPGVIEYLRAGHQIGFLFRYARDLKATGRAGANLYGSSADPILVPPEPGRRNRRSTSSFLFAANRPLINAGA